MRYENDINVTDGMVPCRPNCGCMECRLERARATIEQLSQERDRLREAASLSREYITQIHRERQNYLDSQKGVNKGQCVIAKLGQALSNKIGYLDQ